MTLEEASAMLQQLQQWKGEGLIDTIECKKACSQVIASVSFPPNLDPPAIHHCLKQLKELVDNGSITEDDSKKKKAELLAMLIPMDAPTATSRGPQIPAEKERILDQLRIKLRERDGATTGGSSSSSSAEDRKYFGYYADFAHQELMLNDTVRTSTYQRAILQNQADFKDKVVIDVGTGTGILSMFAAQAGARRVYAVEASAMAHTAEKLIAHNGFSSIIHVVKGKVEEVEIPEMADIIISEPLGFWLFNEQMIQSYVAARDRWLKPGGQMFPCHSMFYIAPCYVPETRKATQQKSASWLTKQNFYGLDFTCAELDCQRQHMERMLVDQIFPSQVVGTPTATLVDFTKISVAELNNLKFPFEWESPSNKMWDAVGLWFDTFFVGSGGTVCLSTRPDEKLTCWYQTLCLFPEPMLQRQFTGHVTFTANAERTYDVMVYGGATPAERDVPLRAFSFTLPVYRYHDHFQDLIWDITLYPDLRAGKTSITPSSCMEGEHAATNGISHTIPLGLPPYASQAQLSCPLAPLMPADVMSFAGSSTGISTTFQDLCVVADDHSPQSPMAIVDSPEVKRLRKDSPPVATDQQDVELEPPVFDQQMDELEG